MPRLPIDYSKIVIYKLVHKEDYDNNDVYIGSTTDFVKRKHKHRTICNNPNDTSRNRRVYQTIQQNGGWDMWCMIEIEKFPCNDKKEAEKREREWFEYYNANLNSQYPRRTMKEWRQDNKTIIAEKKKKYNEDHKERIKEHKKKYYAENKERFKQYYEENKEKILEREKEHYERKKNIFIY